MSIRGLRYRGGLALFALAALLTACGPKFGPTRLGHDLVDRWPDPRPDWVSQPAYQPSRLAPNDSLAFIGRVREGAYLTGKLAALAEADMALGRTIMQRVLACGAMLPTSLEAEPDWLFAAKQVSSSVQSGAAPPLEYFEQWQREDGSTYYRWWVRSVIRGRDVRESMNRSVELLDPEVSESVRRAIRSCMEEGSLP